jgi:hypothetical protein
MISAYSDSMNNQKLTIDKQLDEIETLEFQLKDFQNKLNASNFLIYDLKDELEVLKNKEQSRPEELHYYSYIVSNDSYMLKSIKSKIFKYPEKTTLSEELRYTKSYSELEEYRLWKKDSLSFAFVIVKDTKKVPNTDPHAGEGDLSEIGIQVTFSCYILKFIDSDYSIYMNWNNTLEPCFLTAESDDENIDFHLTDINGDSNFEIWYVIESFCSLGVEPYKLQICLFNDSLLYTMESATNSPGFFTDDDIKEYYAINKFDPNFEKLSQEFKSYAIELRNKNIFGSAYYWR